MADKLTKANLKRTTAYKRLQETYEAGIKASSDESLKSTFLARADTIDNIYNEFQSAHNTVISLIDDDNFSAYDKMRISADEAYYGVKSLKYDFLLTDSASQMANVSLNPNSNILVPTVPKIVAKLPKLSLPIFDGNYRNWPSFYDLFKSLIHDNADLSNIEKFQYLLTSLNKEPLALVKGIPLTEANYCVAYEMLEKRYQNKRILATQYYNEIFYATSIQKATSKDLRHLLNIFSENVAALRVLKFPVEQWDFLLFNMLQNKLDSKTRTDFELENSLSQDLPTYRQLITFLERQCMAFESVQFTTSVVADKSTLKLSNNYQQFSNRKPTSNFATNPLPQNKEPKCILCSSAHALFKCQLFLAKTPQERFSYAKQHKLCVNCLVSPHSIKNCGSTHKCRICRFPHHTVLHFNKNLSSNIPSVDNITPHSNSDTATAVAHFSGNNQSNSAVTNIHCIANTLSAPQHTILLSTCELEIKDIRGNFQKIRALLDTGSMANFVSESCVRRLGLCRSKFSIPVEGLNGMSTSTNSGIVHCVIKPCSLSIPIFSFEAIVIPKVCSSQPKIHINVSELKHIRNLKLADSRFHVPGPIDMLIGAELVPLFLKSDRIFGDFNQPVALETIFGYILQGKISCSSSVNSADTLLSCHASLDENLDLQLRKFWEVEQITKIPCLSPEDKKCEEIYKTSTFREPSGRFSVPLPFRQSKPNFIDTYSQAYRRFCMLESRFLKNSELYKKYANFMQDYLDSGHMSLVPQKDFRFSSAYYIPHHAVFKEQTSSSKIRVVFDASLRDIQGVSLNDTLFVGPKLQRDIFALLLSFRIFSYVFVCDIKQMYRQINVHPEFWNFQRILWRFSPSEPLQEYFLRTVVYGVSSSPYLALRTLHELATQEEASFPRAAQAIRRQFYIDDGLIGSHDLESALSLQSELIEVMRRGGFELSKWASNHPKLLSHIAASEVQDSCSFDKDEPFFIKILGLKWDPSSDVFSYTYVPLERPCTKRNILSEVSRIFDPLGFVSPCLLLAKRLLQLLWESKVSWDDSPSKDIIEIWTKFKAEMPKLADIKIPRHVGSNSISRLELHGFCDASQTGYASVVYFRVEDTLNNIKTFLVCAKCRVSPLKTISIARLELLAAVLLADLVSFVKESYTDLVIFDAIHAWSDSMVTLAWLSSSPHKWKTFIANRVSHIQELLPLSAWHYVPSVQNPADCASRGQTPLQLLDTSIWWSGPEFLSQSRNFWPTQPELDLQTNSNISHEGKQTILTISIPLDNFIFRLLNRFSSLPKIQRIVAHIFRFISNSRSKVKIQGPLTPAEIENSLRIIVKHVQRDVFSDIYLKIEKNSLLSKPFRKLAPFVDSDGLLRVGGRLRKSQFSYDVKHPILLPKSHRITELIIEWTHHTNLHPGLKTLHYLLLQQFWILSPRSAIYKCLSRCIRCFRCKPKSYNPYMADLPALRISQVKAFSSVCIDFAGPFPILMSKHRGAKTFKGYVCVFVCTATKAIHLEVTSDLSSEAFLAAFRRFGARRGKCVTITSDQGTNFKGANHQLLDLAQEAAQKLCISWRFNAPGSPHFNGLAEAGVKSFKSHLYRVLGSQTLSYEEFYTLLTQIESLLNSRPLCAISSDPNDLQPLTPGHFLILEPLNNFIPDPDLSRINLNRLNRWQLIQRLQSDFWKRWSQEYIHSLQERHKWTEPSPIIAEGALVLIKNEQKAPLHWEMGRIIKLHPGQDGVVRVVTLKTAHGVMQRPVVKICPLPDN